MGIRRHLKNACALTALVAPALAGAQVGATDSSTQAQSAPGTTASTAPVPEAQVTPGGAPAPEAIASAGDIIVTARRREEALQDVPISVSALTGAQLERAGVRDVQGLQFQTPSLSITSAQSQRNTVAFALRGQRVQETQLFTDPPVGTYFAEVVQPRPYGFGHEFYDLQSVQVLKGVQGTLFGRNMTGGAVLVEPAHPVIGKFSGDIAGQYGNYDMKDFTGSVNVPVNDWAALRVAGNVHRRDGWARDVSGLRLDNQHSDSFRVSGLVRPIDGLESLTIFDYFRSRERGTASFLTQSSFPSVLSNYVLANQFGLIDTNIPAQIAEAQQLFKDHRFTENIGAGKGGNLDVFGKPFENIKNYGVTNKTTYQLSDDITLKNVFGYRKVRRAVVQDYDGLPATLISPFQFAHTRNISEEFQVQGKALNQKLEYILGAFYFDEKGLDGSLANTLPELNLLGAGLNPRTASASTFITQNTGSGYERSAAGFVAGTYHITDTVSLSGGARYNYDKRKITVVATQPNRPDGAGGTGVCIFDTDDVTPGVQSVPLNQCAFSNAKTFKEWTYDGTLQYQPTHDLNVYASYRHGFRAGGFSTRATSDVALRPFLPEFVNEYEIGLKTSNRVFGNARLNTTVALFRQDGSDVQKQRASFVNGQVYTVVDNTAKQRNQGGEFEATLAVPNFTLTAFYSYTQVKIKAGRVVLNGLPEIDQRGTPKHQAGATATVSPPIDDRIGSLNLVTNISYRSKNYLDDFEVAAKQPGFALLNLRAELNDVGGSKASVAAFVNNVTNETYRIGVLGLVAEGLGFSSSVYGEPRMYGMEVRYKF